MKYARDSNKFDSDGVLGLILQGIYSGIKQAIKVLWKDARRAYIKNTIKKLKTLKEEYPESTEEVDRLLEKLYFIQEYA